MQPLVLLFSPTLAGLAPRALSRRKSMAPISPVRARSGSRCATRQRRCTEGAQREVEQLRPALGFHRDDRWLRRETGATRRGPTTTDRVSLQTIDESWRQSRWQSTAKLCCRSVSRLHKEIAHARTADSGGYHRSVLGMRQPLESDSAMAPPRRPGDRPLRGGEPKWPRSPKIRDSPKDIAKCSKSCNCAAWPRRECSAHPRLQA